MKKLMWRYGIEVIEAPIPPAEEDEIIGKVIMTAFSPVDRAVASGFIPYDVGRVPGSPAVVRVIEPPVSNARVEEGGLYFVRSRCFNRIHGYNADGFLSDYGKAHKDCLIKLPPGMDINVRMFLNLEYSYIDYVANKLIPGKVLIMGCNLESYIVSRTLHRLGYEVLVSCNNEKVLKLIASEGIKVVKPNKVEGLFDAVIVTDFLSCIKSSRYLRDYGSLIIPPTQPPCYISRVRDGAQIIIPNQDLTRNDYLGGVSASILKNFLAVTNTLDDVPALARFFEKVIYVFKKSRE